jgi:transglycosylase-like protein with SLT domain
MPADLAGIGSVAAGIVFLYAGIKGKSVTAALTSIVKGESPAGAATANPITVTDESQAITNVPGTNTGPTAAGDTGAATTTAAVNQAAARLLAAPYGWSTGQQWADLVSLWNQESGWSNTAQNPTSTAYGIAQFLDTTWGPYGPKTSDPVLQVTYGLEYIKDTYGSPTAAWAHEVANNWY